MPKRKQEPEVREEDRGAEFLAQRAMEHEKAKGGARAKLLPFIPMIGQQVYYHHESGWYVHVTIRDCRFAWGRVDFLVEQADKVAWVKASACYHPPGTSRSRAKEQTQAIAEMEKDPATGRVYEQARAEDGDDGGSEPQGPVSPGGDEAGSA